MALGAKLSLSKTAPVSTGYCDGEHSPLDLRTMLAQLQSVATSPVHLKRGPPLDSGRPALERVNGGNAPKIMLMPRGVFHCNCAKLSPLA
jgi:hypothetical protein